jgi:hypothetical protein
MAGRWLQTFLGQLTTALQQELLQPSTSSEEVRRPHEQLVALQDLLYCRDVP